ncbi:MAG TPA: ABC transporter permease [Bacteroidia bacterium]|nr:ABC transporter permease [Bacteroidia bacterium]
MFFTKNKKAISSESITGLTWKRFRKNRGAMLGLYAILFSVVIACLGYSITPDQSPDANEQNPELHVLKPGSRVNFLLIAKRSDTDSRGFIMRMLFGEPGAYQAIPIYSHTFRGPNLVVEEFSGHTPNKGAQRVYSIARVLYPLETKKPLVYDSLKRELRFTREGDDQESVAGIDAMQRDILEKHFESRFYLLGTDLLGRDVLSRLIIGTRISLSVGLLSVLIALLIGITLGALAGYYRGITDSLIMWLINVVWSIPTLLLVIAITLVLGKGVLQVFIAVGLTMWVEVARIVRGQILSLREKEFVEAGRALGFSDARIIFRHVLPNVMGPVIVIAAGNFASAILMEAGLSFLGIGAQPPMPSWGEMINAHRGYILMDKAYLAFIPGLAIMLLVLAFMMLGNGLRDAMDNRIAEKSK